MGEAKAPATKEELQQKYDAMFPEIKTKTIISKFGDTLKRIEQNTNFGLQINGNKMSQCDCNENKLDIENGKYLLMIFQITSQELNQPNEQNKTRTSEGTNDKPSNKIYKIKRLWNPPEDEPEHDFYFGGYFKAMNPPDVFWVNTIRKIDGRLSGYYKEYGGSRGWVNLEYADSTDFDTPKKVNESLKRKR